MQTVGLEWQTESLARIATIKSQRFLKRAAEVTLGTQSSKGEVAG